jgi:hypothetical protein
MHGSGRLFHRIARSVRGWREECALRGAGLPVYHFRTVNPPLPPPPASASPASPELPEPLALQDPARPTGPGTQLSSLSVSLMQDLTRAELGEGERRALLEVLAASLRHGQALSARLLIAGQPVVVTVFPHQRLMHCQRRLEHLLATDLLTWQVVEVLPALVRAPVSMTAPGTVAIEPPFAALEPLLWAVALAGARAELLPELAGQVAFRVSPGADLAGLYIPSTMQLCINRLRRATSSVAELALWEGIGTERATRLLNALYLQSALVISRSHPAATNEGWRGYGR